MLKDDKDVEHVFINDMRLTEFSNLQADNPVCFVINRLRTGAKFWFFLDKPYSLTISTGDNTPIVFKGEGLANFTLLPEGVGSCFQLWGGPNYWRIIPHFLPTVRFTSQALSKGK